MTVTLVNVAGQVSVFASGFLKRRATACPNLFCSFKKKLHKSLLADPSSPFSPPPVREPSWEGGIEIMLPLFK